MRGNWIAFLPAIFICTSNLAAVDLQELEEEKKLLENLMDRTLNGKDPCFNSECQKQKEDALSEVFQTSELMASKDKDFISRREAGMNSALQIISHPLVKPDYTHYPKT